MIPSHLHAAAWTLGARRVLPSEVDAETAERLRREEIEGYHRAAEEPWRMAVSAAEETLKRSGLAVGDVDLVLYACESTDRRTDISLDPDRFAEALGAPSVPLMGVAANGCANLGALLRSARNAVAAGDAGTVLIVTTDAWDDRPRLVGAGTALMSDSAATALVSAARPDEGWLIGDIFTAVDHTMHAIDPAVDTIAMVRGTAQGVRDAAAGFFVPGRPAREDYTAVVADNLGAMVLKILASSAGLDRGRVFAQTSLHGHCFAADILLNLSAVAPGTPPGAKVLGLITGHNYWTCVGLERLGAA
ncbi:hypothetical protein [Actinomadura rubrisoli]|uniref:3-oxoacyl-ACP synthase n=1 Tax=Actinomadura rubrisoli TaxID=2530368 RepID=A0A4R5B7C4_9ACTN|nr:hypothetical protein [Actinomadura rubrisoli]TDD79192.1 hypothetical protein E1298_28235 [Actinomadura rubrisoli]